MPKLSKRLTPSIQKLDSLAKLGVIYRDRHLGPMCRICGNRPWVVAYHIVPKQRGNAVRWVLSNIVLACTNCNYGEMRNRSLYRDKHIVIFGKEYVERIEQVARDGNGKQVDKFAVLAELKRYIEQGKYK